MQKVITVRVEPSVEKRLETVAKKRLEKKSDVIRKALIEYLNRESELKEIKKQIAQRFAEGKITFENMAEILGYNEAKKIAYLVEMAKDSFEEGL